MTSREGMEERLELFERGTERFTNESEPPPDWRPSVLGLAVRSPAIWSLVALVFVAVFAPLLSPYGPMEFAGAQNLPPSAAHFFGTDGNGMDVFSRVLYAARIDLLLPLLATVISVTVGTYLGLLSGYFHGLLDATLQRLADIFQAFPVVILSIAMLAALGTSIRNLVLVVALVGTPLYYRIVRTIVRPLRSAEFIDAAVCSGHSRARIVFSHLLPAARPSIEALFPNSFATAIQVLAGLSFLGLGVRVPNPEWGVMIQQGAGGIVLGHWWTAMFPGAAIFVVVLTLNRVSAWSARTWRAR